MVIAFTVSFVAYGTRTMNAAILQIHRDLEEAALISGASQWRTVRRIFVPLVMPSMAGLWIWAVLHAVRAARGPAAIELRMGEFATSQKPGARGSERIAVTVSQRAFLTVRTDEEFVMTENRVTGRHWANLGVAQMS